MTMTSATPAQIANDMVAQAKFWSGRNMDIELACQSAANVLRKFLKGERPHGNAVRGALQRIDRLLKPGALQDGHWMLASLDRAQAAIADFDRESRRVQ